MFKKVFITLLALLTLNLTVFASTPLDRGTTLIVRILSSTNSKSGTTPTAMVEEDVRNKNGTVVIKKGTLVELQVNREKAKGCGRPGTLFVNCISTRAVDNQYIVLNGELKTEGNDKRGLAIGLGVGLGVTFLPFVGFAFFAIKGEQATIQPNTLISNVFVMNDYLIEE